MSTLRLTLSHHMLLAWYEKIITKNLTCNSLAWLVFQNYCKRIKNLFLILIKELASFFFDSWTSWSKIIGIR